MKEAVAGELAAAYDSAIVDRVRANDFRHESGRLTVHLAREFGFCYGVDRAVDYAYQARRRFPGRNVFLTGEIIHNPHVNDRLRGAGIRFLSDAGERADRLGADDVVILPAFGVTVSDMAQLSSQGCTLVDTTCGSVLNVWKNVVRYAQDGFTVDHPRQGQARGNPRDRVAGAEVPERPLPRRARPRRSGHRLRLHPIGRRSRRVSRAICRRRLARLRSGPRSDAHRLREPDDDADDRIAGDRRDVPRRDARAVRRGRARLALPGVRHDLQRDAGTPGRRHRPARGAAAGSDARRRRLQQQQHVQPGAHLRREGADVSHRRAGLPHVGRRSPATGRSSVAAPPAGCRRSRVGGCPSRAPWRSA